MRFDSVLQAFRLLWAYKLRATLTLFGLVWGTAAVIFLVGWGGGARIMVESGFGKAGKNMARARTGSIGEDFTPAVDRRELWFTWQDALFARQRAKLPELVGAERLLFQPVAFGQSAQNFEVRGVEPVGIQIRTVSLESGRQLAQADVVHRKRVAVLGHKARRKILGPSGRLGDQIRIGGRGFEVVGFLRPVGVQFSTDGDELDDQVWVPLTTHHALWPSDVTEELNVTTVLFRLRDRALLDETLAEMRSILSARLRVSASDDEAILMSSPVSLLRDIPLDQQTGVMFILAATTMIIGGIGVLNMMLDSVRERRREIGVRLAVGATQRDIVVQFFLETLTIVIIGGSLGMAIGVGGCLTLASLGLPDTIPIPVLTPGIVLLAVGTMSIVGFGAGVIPAWRAAQTDPAHMLRAE